MTTLSVWQKDKKELAEKREAFWEYVALLGRIVETKSYLEEYDTAEAFIKEEASFSKTHFYDLVRLCETRKRLSAIADSPPERINHLKEITKVPEEKQKEVFAATMERCEQENREPTAKDFRKTAKEIVEEADWEYVEKDENEPLEEGEIDCGPVESSNGKPKKTQDAEYFCKVCIGHAEAIIRHLDDAKAERNSPQHEPLQKKACEIVEGLRRW